MIVRSLAITGAGDSGYLSVIKQRLHEELYECSNIDKMNERLEEVLEEFYERHIVPFPPGQWRDLDVELIVAASVQSEHRLWVTYMNTVRRVESFATVGAGSAWAANSLRGFIPAITTERAGVVVAAYAVFEAKENSKECGKDTLIVSIPETVVSQVADPRAVRKMEDCFNRIDWIDRSRRWTTLGMKPIWDLGGGPDGEYWQIQGELAAIDPFPIPSWAKDHPSSNPSSETSQT
jgi:hypothetical protein